MASIVSETRTNYVAGAYCRLSKDDARYGESLSIENQKKILTNYLDELGVPIYKFYVDDGVRGGSFEREGFQEMRADAQKGKINLIVIKDTTRFGRNYVQSGLYFEEISQLIGVRFISISENIDTIDPNCPALKMMPFYFVFAEMQSSQLSDKVKTTFRELVREGKKIGGQAPFGYQKDPFDKHKLIPDDESAQIVKYIFELRSSGKSYRSIAKKLGDENVQTPLEYWSAKRLNDKNIGELKTSIWDGKQVRGITDNPVYIGSIVNNKYAMISFKNKKLRKNSIDKWNVAENMHEPIIDRETWEKVRNLSDKNECYRSRKNGEPNMFSGVLKCGKCGGAMVVGSVKKRVLDSGEFLKIVTFRCNRHATKGDCVANTIGESDVAQIVFDDLKKRIEFCSKDEEKARQTFLKKKNAATLTALKSIRLRISELEKRKREIDVLSTKVYEDKLAGKIPEKICIAQIERYESESAQISNESAELNAQINFTKNAELNVDNFVKLVKRRAEIKALTREIVVELIDKILIGERLPDGRRNIEIFYKYLGE